MRYLTICAAVAAASLGGCATHSMGVVTLTVESQPAGAYITPIGESSGSLATLTRSWQASEMSRYKQDAKGCYLVPGYAARWGSGATAVSPNTIELCGNAGAYTYTLTRDPSLPGLDRDLEFALKVQRHSQQQASARDARDNAAVEAAAAGFAGAMGALAAGQQRQQAPIRCTSKQVFERVETNCN